MAGKRRSTRKTGKTVLSRASAPIGQALMAVGNSAKEVVSFAGDVAKRSVKGAHKIGKVWVKHANKAVGNVTNTRRRRRK